MEKILEWFNCPKKRKKFPYKKIFERAVYLPGKLGKARSL